jgi:hypothetical protein
VLHVFTKRTLPPIANNREADLQARRAQLLARHLPGRPAWSEWRTGHAAAAVADVCNQQGGDLVIVSWG